MAQFPSKEAEIAALARQMVSGLDANKDVYPEPPVEPQDLDDVLEAYLTTREEATAARAEASRAVAIKDEALQALTDDMKEDLRYAENTVHFEDEPLRLLGWGGRKAGTSLQAPGQPRALEAPRQGADWIYLDWKAPAEGGAVAVYRVDRRDRADGSWSQAGVSIESEITITNQARGTEWEYRVVAMNRAGEGEPSNAVMAVL